MQFAKKKSAFIIPTNAMSDVAFLLLIFIMLVALINYRKEVKIEYPEALPENMKKMSAEKNVELWIDGSGAFYLDGILCDIQVIEDAVTDLYLNAPETRVHIIADRNVPFEKVNAVLAILQLLQYRVVSLVVKD
ncbi:MAG: biopolymer transporter ExbD [Spirochaetaceae bacterium]|nr:biopolymer transporter ExbD [Spirochaetaceae bacterium]